MDHYFRAGGLEQTPPAILEALRNAGATGQHRPVRSILLQWDAALRRCNPCRYKAKLASTSRLG
jgi:hypothetical protein